MLVRIMFRSLLLKNFQKHRKKLIEFSPTITVIVGDSDQGKTSLLRCLRWVCLNLPAGTAFIRHGEDHVYARLKFDGYEVLRERGPSMNGYSLNGHCYQAFGQDVPEAIASLLNVSSLNFQRQLDSPFWFDLTPGQVSKEMNSIIDLSLIDEAFVSIASVVRKAKATVEVSEDRLKLAREERDSLKHTVQIDEQLRSLERVQESITEKRSQIASLFGLLQEASETRGDRDRSSVIVSEAVSLLRRGETWSELRGSAETLSNLLRSVAETRGEASVSVPDLSELEALQERAEEQRERVETLNSLLTEIQQTRGRERTAEAERAEADATLTQEMGERCPLCDRATTF